MQKYMFIIIAILATATLFAQSPNKISYQAVIRDGNNQLVTSTQIGMQISILEGSVDGSPVYSETQTPTTNNNGLLTIAFGGATGWDAIDWSSGVFFIKTETDPKGGENYTITGVSQLLSVPFALNAIDVVNKDDADADSTNEIQDLENVLTSDNSAGNQQIKDLANPVDSQDAVTLAYLEKYLKDHGIIPDSVTFVYNGQTVTYGTVRIGGRDWLDRNLGATRVATSMNDTEAIGDLFQWGREADGHQLRTSSVVTAQAAPIEQPGHGDFITPIVTPYDWNQDNQWIDRWSDAEGMKTSADVCPEGWRVPTFDEWQSIADAERWSSFEDAYLSKLRIVSTDERTFTGVFNSYSDRAIFWTASPAIEPSYHGAISFEISNTGNPEHPKLISYGLPIRCIKE